MNTLTRSLLALGLVALMAAPASAQQRRGGFGGGFGGGGVTMLLSNEGVIDELKLDDAQKGKVRDIVEKARDKREEAASNLEGQERFAKMREVGPQIDAEAKKALADVLKPEQFARLKGITYQTQGPNAFQDEELQKALKLTDDQKSAIQGIVQDSMTEMREAMQDLQGDRESAMSKMRELRKGTISKIESKLTSEQKAEYAKLLGAPYEVRFQGGPGAGRNRNN